MQRFILESHQLPILKVFPGRFCQADDEHGFSGESSQRSTRASYGAPF